VPAKALSADHRRPQVLDDSAVKIHGRAKAAIGGGRQPKHRSDWIPLSDRVAQRPLAGEVRMSGRRT
jgi:hypothetical protein